LLDLSSISTVEVLGWAAAGVFTTSYFFTRARALRRAQMLGAGMWLAYGVLLHANPVVVANVLNLVAMVWTGRRAARSSSAPRLDAPPTDAPEPALRGAPIGDPLAGREPIAAFPEL
jgi:hypothetical protein